MPTKIDWTDESWNPVTGCTKISTGCKFCYAERKTKRLVAMGTAKYAAGFDTVVCHPDTLEIPLRWKKPRLVFVNSMSDLFHKDVPDEFIAEVFYTMARTERHTFQLLTKRPERAVAALAELGPVWDHAAFYQRDSEYPLWPLPNVWLGTSVENQEMANERIPHLLRCPAAGHFLSVEPLLEEIVLQQAHCTECDAWVPGDLSWGHPCGARDAHGKPLDACEAYRDLGIDWVIIGCESGPKRRPFKNEWARDLVQQCAAAGVPVFVKQLRDEHNNVVRGPAEWDGWPDWARRDFPEKESKL